MIHSPAFLRSCQSATDLAHASGVALPSPAFEAFLDAAAGAQLTAPQRALLSPLANRLPERLPSLVVNCSGRGSWKSTAGAWMSLWHAACVDHDKHAQAGTRIYCVHVAPSKKQAAEIVRQVRAIAEQCGIPHDVRDAGGDSTEIVLARHWGRCERVIAVWPASAAHGRGFAACFVHLAEHGHWRSGELHLDTDRAVNQALAGRLGQFPKAQRYSESTPGAPRGLFFEWVTAPPKGALLVRGSTMQWNPNAREEDLRAHVPDAREFSQEILAKVFGLAGDGLLDSAACEACIDRDGTLTARRFPGPSQVVALDVAHKDDGMAFVRVAATARQVAVGKAPVRGVAVTHAERWQGSRDRPLNNRDIARHAVAISRDAERGFGGCPIVLDQHYFLTIADFLREEGYRELSDVRQLTGATFMKAPMHAAAQTSRFRLLREVVHGANRLAIPDTRDGRALVAELAELRAWELAGGLMKVEGLRTDDLADALALATEVAVLGVLRPVGENGCPEWVDEGIGYDHDLGLRRFGHWAIVDPVTGKETPAPWPIDDPEFAAHLAARESGVFTADEVDYLESVGFTAHDLVTLSPADVRAALDGSMVGGPGVLNRRVR